MKCPNCSKPLAGPSWNCPSCEYSFSNEEYGRISLYWGLKGEVEQIQAVVKDDLWVRLKDLAKRIEQFDELVSSDTRAGSGRIQAGPRPPTAGPSAEPVSAGEGRTEEEVVTAASGPGASPYMQQTPQVKPAMPSSMRPVTQKDSQGFEANVGQKWLLIIGIVTMVFGVGYFLKYSFEQGWVGPAGRVAMAYIWGAVMLGAGNLFRRREFETFGLYMIGGGIATLYASTFAAFQLYHLFGQIPSFSLMVLITLLAGSLAIVYDAKWLAVLGLTGGFLTPVLLSTGQDNQVALMTYMAILNLGLLGIALHKKWDLLNILGFVFTYLLFSAWYLDHYSDYKFWPSILFLNLFYLIYSVIPFAYQFLKTERRPLEGFLIITPNSFIAFGYSYFMIRGYASLEWVSAVSIFYAVVFLAMATYLVRTGRQDEEAFTVLLAKAALFLIITIPMLVSRHWITIFWAVQAGALLWMGVRLQRRRLGAGAYLLLALAIGKFLFYDYEEVFHFRAGPGYISGSYPYLLAERLVTSAVLLVAAFWFSFSARAHGTSLLTKDGSDDSRHISAVAGMLLFIVLNVETAAFFHEYLPAARFAAVSVLWAVFSVALIIMGFRRRSALLRKTSLGLFGVTIFKVFLFDMSNISTPYRIISFIILGLMLVGTSYLYYKFRGRIEGVAGNDK